MASNSQNINFLKNTKLTFIVSLLLILYSTIIVPSIDSKYLSWSKNLLVLLIAISLIALLSCKNYCIALMLTIALFMTLHYSSNKENVFIVSPPYDNTDNSSFSAKNILNTVKDTIYPTNKIEVCDSNNYCNSYDDTPSMMMKDTAINNENEFEKNESIENSNHFSSDEYSLIENI
jgi:hypothetical protein